MKDYTKTHDNIDSLIQELFDKRYTMMTQIIDILCNREIALLAELSNIDPYQELIAIQARLREARSELAEINALMFKLYGDEALQGTKGGMRVKGKKE